jgi:hypothetical protein
MKGKFKLGFELNTCQWSKGTCKMMKTSFEVKTPLVFFLFM